MQVSDAQKLKTLKDGGRCLKKLLAESMLDVAALKDILGKSRSHQRRAGTPRFAGWMSALLAKTRLRLAGGRSQDGAPHPRAGRGGGSGPPASLAAEHRRFGYRRLGVLLQREGLAMNNKKLFRLYCEVSMAPEISPLMAPEYSPVGGLGDRPWT